MQSKKTKGTNTVVHGDNHHVLAVTEVTAIIHVQRGGATVEAWEWTFSIRRRLAGLTITDD